MSDTTAETVRQFADQLRAYAEHFAPMDWEYTRHHTIRRIREVGDFSGYGRIDKRIGSAFTAVFPMLTKRGRMNRDTEFGRMVSSRAGKWAMVKIYLATDRHLPDGSLDRGCIITHWEEHGEYLQYVQPTVGSMLADWMEAEPDNPHALRIAGEMKRINDRYAERIAAEEGARS